MQSNAIHVCTEGCNERERIGYDVRFLYADDFLLMEASFQN